VIQSGIDSNHSFSKLETLPDGFLEKMSARALEVGDLIPRDRPERYKLVAVLGGGGMGQVFAAENLAIGLKVAIKVVKRELLANPEFRQRFQQEAQIVAAIEHPNVARFLDLVIADPVFLVMEYVHGPTLSHVLKQEKRLTVERAVLLATRLCWGLQAVHQAGVVHRDLKPSNIILAPDPELGETPKIIDFGLAKIAGATHDGAQITRAGQLIGTPQYMAPEQVAGKAVDARSDVYSLGVVLYEMLAGKPPFAAITDDVQILYRQLHEPPEPIEKLVPGLPPPLCGVIACALSKRAEDRYRTMRELATALGAAMARSRAPAPAGSRKSWLGARFLSGVAAGALLGGAVSFVALHRAPGPPIVASQSHAADEGLLLLTTTPSGATIELDGRTVSETSPTAVRGLKPGEHRLRVHKQGLTPIERRVTLEAGQRLALELSLPPGSHRIEVRSVPNGASVHLDGNLVQGVTPLEVSVSDGELHELRIEKNGYEPVVQAIEPDAEAALPSLTLQPEKRPRGLLSVDANGASEVWIDGVDTGFVTPTLPMHVAAGAHVVELRAAGGNRIASAKVMVAQGATSRVVLGTEGGKP
jgi:serine/threonine protein kinase